MGRASQAAQRAKRNAELPERIRELSEIEAQNLPRNEGDALGYLQWTDIATGQTRRWIVRIGDRIDRITVQSPQSKPTPSMGWATFMVKLRKHLVK